MSAAGGFPIPLVETNQSDEFENMKQKLMEAMQTIKIRQKEADDLLLQLEEMKENNKKLNDHLELKKFSSAEMKKKEEEINSLLTENSSKTEQLEFYRIRVLELAKDVDKVTQEKVQSESEKMERIELLTTENRNLNQENITIKMLNTEMSQEIETLTMLKNELEANVVQTRVEPEPEVNLVNELEDTTCAICTEEMRLRKCHPCRRRFHKRCLETWLQEHDTCPTCRAKMN